MTVCPAAWLPFSVKEAIKAVSVPTNATDKRENRRKTFSSRFFRIARLLFRISFTAFSSSYLRRTTSAYFDLFTY